MPLQFPSNPSVNQTSTQNGRVYKWSGHAWEFSTSVGIVGSTAASVETRVLSAAENNYDAGVANILRVSSTASSTISGISGGEGGVVKLIYNVGTNSISIASESPASVATNRVSVSSGSVSLQGGDSATIWYDGTSQRWRVLEDQVSGSGGGGIAMSYLFG